MHRASSSPSSWLVLAVLALAVGCNPPTPPVTLPPTPEPEPSRVVTARLSVSLPPDAPSGEVTRVSATLTASDFSARSLELTRSGSTWTGVFSEVPVGSGRAFSAEAFDASGHKRYVGGVENLSAVAGQELGVSFTLQRVPPPVPTHGGADIDISLNRRPVLSGLTASPSRVDVGQRTTVSALVADPEGDALAYQWSASGCTGLLEDAASPSARFTPDARPSGDACGTCRLSLLVTDARGAQTHGSLGLCVGPAPSASFAPQIVDIDMEDTNVGQGQPVRLGVRAWDPQGSALTFTWEPVIGHFDPEPTHTATTSTAVWVVPACIPFDAYPPVRVTVRNAAGQTAVAPFPLTFDGVPTCNTHWVPTGALASPREGHTATLLESGKVLVIGGWDGTRALATPELFDPNSGEWTPLTPMKTPRAGHTATRLDGDRVLVVGGYSAPPLVSLFSAEILDPLTGQWTEVATLDTRRYHHTATRMSWGGIIITGGRNATDQLSNTELYEPGHGTWIYQGDMRATRVQHTATLLPGDKVLVIGGVGTGSNTAESYNYITGKFTPAGTLSRSRSRHTATLLPNGKVLVTGGDTGSGPTDSAELYDPALQASVPARSMASPRAGHTATLLPNGKVLVVGGTNGGGPLNTAELYDPVTNLWGPASSLAGPKQGHTAVRMPSGQVLVTGGSTASAPSATCELYDP
jgi:hypothetical protein